MEKKEYTSSAVLLITADDFDPAEITAELKVTPSQCWRTGSFAELPSGRQHLYKNSGWKLLQKENEADAPLEEQLKNWLSFLSTRRSQLSQFKDKRFLVEIDCFISSSDTISLIFDTEILNGFGSLGVELSLNCFLDKGENL